MKLIEAERKLRAFSEQKRVFRSRELGRVLGESGNTLRSSIKRLLDSGIITRLARDVYWFGDFKGRDVPAIEEVAVALRSGEFNYIGMESAASLWSVISQIPVGRLTVVTTGREGSQLRDMLSKGSCERGDQPTSSIGRKWKMAIDFKKFAEDVARRGEVEALLPIVEKELIHYDIICALDESRWLDGLTFQGGTCLRLCYGAVRYSEDLDFTTALDLEESDLAGFQELLSDSLRSKYDVGVRVKDPKKIKHFEGGGSMKRWQVVVDTAPARPDLPSQKIKIEIAQIPSYTRDLRVLEENYPEVEGMCSRAIIGCQSLDEILADKIVSFSQQVLAPRYRDLWDIPWIALRPGRNMDEVAVMVGRKLNDYHVGENAQELLRSGLSRAREALGSAAFAEEMRRFLPPKLLERTAARPEYREAMTHKVEDVYRFVAERL